MAASRFSIVPPVFETPADVLAAMLRSVRRRQSLWEGVVVIERDNELTGVDAERSPTPRPTPT